MTIEVYKYADLTELSWIAAEEIAREIEMAISNHGRFSIALSGGRTPRLLYEILADNFCDEIVWEKVDLFWGDERYVPPGNPHSNYTMVESTLISKVPIPQQNIHRISTELDSAERAAQEYELTLRNFFSESNSEDDQFTFDLILQGLGEDGHTASLFPGDPLLDEVERWVAPVMAPASYSPQERITLTYPALNSSRKAFFVVSGEGKQIVLNAILNNREEAEMEYPAANIYPLEKTVWFVDQAASGVNLD